MIPSCVVFFPLLRFCTNICTDGAEAKVYKTINTIAWIKVVAPNFPIDLSSFTTMSYGLKEKISSIEECPLWNSKNY